VKFSPQAPTPNGRGPVSFYRSAAVIFMDVARTLVSAAPGLISAPILSSQSNGRTARQNRSLRSRLGIGASSFRAVTTGSGLRAHRNSLISGGLRLISAPIFSAQKVRRAVACIKQAGNFPVRCRAGWQLAAGWQPAFRSHWNAECHSASGCHPASMSLRATKEDENPQRPITNRPPDAVRPHMRPSQHEDLDRAPHHRCGLSSRCNATLKASDAQTKTELRPTSLGLLPSVFSPTSVAHRTFLNFSVSLCLCGEIPPESVAPA
jgi:hypothetical protein